MSHMYKTLDGSTYKIVGDPQRRKVYAWEDKHIAKYDTKLMTLDEAQDFINFVWYTSGRDHPPCVNLARKNARKATGSRLKITIPEKMLYRWILLHEVAHSFTSDVNGASHQHGPKFMKVYISLLEKHLCIPLPLLMYTVKEAGVKVD